MALRIEDEYTESQGADANYPEGSFKNVSSPGGTDGTPYEKAWANDIYGFLQKLLDEASITPSGVPDTVVASDYFDALEFVINNKSAPVGSEIFWTTDTPPADWLEEDGSAISRTTYAALFAVIGTDYGIGDGATTFNLPNPQGRAIRVRDNGAGVDPDAVSRTDRGDGTTGDEVGTNQLDAFQGHIEEQTLKKSVVDFTGNNNQAVVDGNGGSTTDAPFTNASNIEAGGHGTPREADETRMINTNRMLIIKY